MTNDMEVPEGNDFSSTPQVSKDCSDLCLQVTLQNDLVSKETVVLRRWERSKQKFGFIKQKFALTKG